MKKWRNLVPALLAAAILCLSAVPALAAFDQSALDGIIMITTGAPDADGKMSYWRGTGFFIGAEGENPQYIVTNCHVVEEFILAGKALGGGELHVLFDKDDEAEAYLVDYDAEKDVAILRLAEATDKRIPLQMRVPQESSLGSEAYAVGYPAAADLTVAAVNSFSQKDATVTTGSISRFLTESGTGRKLIQTDASLGGGNSGGPLFNQYGEVVGIVSAKYSQSSNGTTVEGLGFAIPMNDVFSMVKDIMTNGYVSNRAYLGITPQTLTEGTAAQFHYDVTSGVFINYVEPDSAADKAGLKMGDVITKVDDTDIKSVEDLNLAKKKYSAGDTATLEVYRPDGSVTVEITWGAAPKEEQVQEQQAQQYPGSGNENYGNGNGGYYSSPFEDLFRYFYR